MRIAQELGLATSATMVIGFGETIEHRIRHLQRLRDLQDESLQRHGNGFTAFIPWTAQISEANSLGRSRFRDRYGATYEEYLRHTAISRIFLDNFDHIQASWPPAQRDTRYNIVRTFDRIMSEEELAPQPIPTRLPSPPIRLHVS